MNREEANAKMVQMAAAYYRLFNTPDGQAVLTDLSMKFKDRQISGQDTTATVARAAQHDVVLHIYHMLEVALRPRPEEGGQNG